MTTETPNFVALVGDHRSNRGGSPTVTVTMDRAVMVFLDEYAAKQGVSRSRAVDSLLRDALKRRRFPIADLVKLPKGRPTPEALAAREAASAAAILRAIEAKTTRLEQTKREAQRELEALQREKTKRPRGRPRKYPGSSIYGEPVLAPSVCAAPNDAS